MLLGDAAAISNATPQELIKLGSFPGTTFDIRVVKHHRLHIVMTPTVSKVEIQHLTIADSIDVVQGSWFVIVPV